MSGLALTDSSLHIIYIPGLGDFYGPARKFFFIFWASTRYHRTVECIDVDWEGEPELPPKLRRIEAAIKIAETQGKEVVLIGESAGAVLALLTYASHPRLKRVVTLCGVSSPDIPLGPGVIKRASALPRAIERLKKTRLPKTPGVMHSFRAYFDPVIAKEFSIAQGATEHVVPSSGHMPTILFCLSGYSRKLLRIVVASS